MFPFGFGLSYTTFVYTGIKASAPSIKDTDGVTIEVAVKTQAMSRARRSFNCIFMSRTPRSGVRKKN